MAWTPEQQQRLSTEKQILDIYLPAFRWENADGKLRVGGCLPVNGGQFFVVRAHIEQTFPYTPPVVLVVEPKPLCGHDGGDLADLDVSPAMHVLTPQDGMVSICHSSAERWSPSQTLYRVFMKARLWLEAYDGHVRTGLPIDHFLHHQGHSPRAPGASA